jgi:hypothetical protein
MQRARTPAEMHESQVTSDHVANVYASQAITVDGKKEFFLYTTFNTPGSDCHACQVTLGAALFEQDGTRWVVKADNRSVGTIGHDGYAQDAKPVQWGTKRYGLLVDDSWTGYCQISTWQTLYGFENGSFRWILTIHTSDTNAASLAEAKDNYGWDAEWRFVGCSSILARGAQK